MWILVEDAKHSGKIKISHKPEPRIHVIRLIDLIIVSKILSETQIEARFLQGRKEVHTGDNLSRAFSFF